MRKSNFFLRLTSQTLLATFLAQNSVSLGSLEVASHSHPSFVMPMSAENSSTRTDFINFAVSERARSEIRATPSKEYRNLVEGVFDTRPDALKEPDWNFMNVIGAAVIDLMAEKKTDRISVGEVEKKVNDILEGQGFETSTFKSAQRIENLITQLSRLGIIDRDNGFVRFSNLYPEIVLSIKLDHVFNIKKHFEEALSVSDSELSKTVASLTQKYIEATSLWPAYPVESKWPVLKAISLLSDENQKKLVDALNAEPSLLSDPLVNSILLMLGGNHLESWLERNAPELRDRTIYYISAETWLAAGGLGRVGQYHSTSMKKLVQNNASMVTIEPYYPLHRDLEGNETPIDYSKLPVPITDLALFDKYEVLVAGKMVKAEVYKGKNEAGIEVYLIKDDENFYTKYLYKYGPEFGTATWEEFSEFFSRASLTLTKRLEAAKRKKVGKKYKSPILIPNDGQLAFLPVFKEIAELEAKDTTLLGAFPYDTTHTHGNRGRIWGNSGYGNLSRMSIPPQYFHYFESLDQNGQRVIDYTGGGLRSTVAQGGKAGGVSAVHAQRVNIFDPMIYLHAITNGDNREFSGEYYRRFLKNPDNPTIDEHMEAKRKSKEAFRDDEILRKLNHRVAELDPNKQIVSYSGRGVPEKAGQKRAFTDENIRAYVKAGGQLVLFVNVQANPQSREIYDHYVRLQDEIDKLGWSGKFIVANGWGIDEQKKLLAATDIQVQDSDFSTGAAEYTEADIAVNGGLQMGPAWVEGIIQRQGVVINWNIEGSGNTLIPENGTPKAYRDVLLKALELYQTDRRKFSSFQVTSVRLSRILSSDLTAAEYLRMFNDGILDPSFQQEVAARKFLSQSPNKNWTKKEFRHLFALAVKQQSPKHVPLLSSGVFRFLEKATPAKRETYFREIANLTLKQAREEFGESALPRIMALIAVLAPKLLDEKIKTWNSQVMEVLNELRPEFEGAEIEFYTSADDKGGIGLAIQNTKTKLLLPIYLPPAQPQSGNDFIDNKYWFNVDGIILDLLEDSYVEIYDYTVKSPYPDKRVSELTAGYRVGVSVVPSKDTHEVAQFGWQFQALRIKPKAVTIYSNANHSDVARSEVRYAKREVTSAGDLHLIVVTDQNLKLAKILSTVLAKENRRTADGKADTKAILSLQRNLPEGGSEKIAINRDTIQVEYPKDSFFEIFLAKEKEISPIEKQDDQISYSVMKNMPNTLGEIENLIRPLIENMEIGTVRYESILGRAHLVVFSNKKQKFEIGDKIIFGLREKEKGEVQSDEFEIEDAEEDDVLTKETAVKIKQAIEMLVGRLDATFKKDIFKREAAEVEDFKKKVMVFVRYEKNSPRLTLGGVNATSVVDGNSFRELMDKIEKNEIKPTPLLPYFPADGNEPLQLLIREIENSHPSSIEIDTIDVGPTIVDIYKKVIALARSESREETIRYTNLFAQRSPGKSISIGSDVLTVKSISNPGTTKKAANLTLNETPLHGLREGKKIQLSSDPDSFVEIRNIRRNAVRLFIHAPEEVEISRSETREVNKEAFREFLDSLHGWREIKEVDHIQKSLSLGSDFILIASFENGGWAVQIMSESNQNFYISWNLNQDANKFQLFVNNQLVPGFTENPLRGIEFDADNPQLTLILDTEVVSPLQAQQIPYFTLPGLGRGQGPIGWHIQFSSRSESRVRSDAPYVSRETTFRTGVLGTTLIIDDKSLNIGETVDGGLAGPAINLEFDGEKFPVARRETVLFKRADGRKITVDQVVKNGVTVRITGFQNVPQFVSNQQINRSEVREVFRKGDIGSTLKLDKNQLTIDQTLTNGRAGRIAKLSLNGVPINNGNGVARGTTIRIDEKVAAEVVKVRENSVTFKVSGADHVPAFDYLSDARSELRIDSLLSVDDLMVLRDIPRNVLSILSEHNGWQKFTSILGLTKLSEKIGYAWDRAFLDLGFEAVIGADAKLRKQPSVLVATNQEEIDRIRIVNDSLGPIAFKGENYDPILIAETAQDAVQILKSFGVKAAYVTPEWQAYEKILRDPEVSIIRFNREKMENLRASVAGLLEVVSRVRRIADRISSAA